MPRVFPIEVRVKASARLAFSRALTLLTHKATAFGCATLAG
jgi:hypothetical protein